jgi:hypothetical protein
VTISQGQLLKVDAASKRKLQPVRDEVRILAIGCTPEGAYERPEAFQIGVRA